MIHYRIGDNDMPHGIRRKAPRDPMVNQHKAQRRADGRGKMHKYRSFPRIGSGDVAVEYCVRHKRWETISARWTHHGFLKFKVVRHRKDRRW